MQSICAGKLCNLCKTLYNMSVNHLSLSSQELAQPENYKPIGEGKSESGIKIHGKRCILYNIKDTFL